MKLYEFKMSFNEAYRFNQTYQLQANMSKCLMELLKNKTIEEAIKILEDDNNTLEFYSNYCNENFNIDKEKNRTLNELKLIYESAIKFNNLIQDLSINAIDLEDLTITLSEDRNLQALLKWTNSDSKDNEQHNTMKQIYNNLINLSVIKERKALEQQLSVKEQATPVKKLKI